MTVLCWSMFPYSKTAFRRYADAWRTVFDSADLPGYRMLPFATRCALDLRALCVFLRSAECAFMGAVVMAWLLASYTVVWVCSLHGPAAALLPSLALLWALPWAADARRRALQNLLGDRWQ